MTTDLEDADPAADESPVDCEKCGKHPALPRYACLICGARCCDECAPAGMGVPCLDCEEPER